MLLLDGRLAELRAAITDTHAARWRRLADQCDIHRGTTPPAEHPSASITYFGPAAANLALAYTLSGQPGYRDEAWRWISTAISYPHWGKAHLPDHDLDAGWLLHGLSLAYDWLRDELPAERTDALREKLILQGTRLYDYAVETEGRWWSSSYWQNHNWICYAGLATAGYALDRPEWTERAKDNFARVVDLLPADGSDSEGVVYWRYGVPWLATYLDLLWRTEGADWWQRCRFLANTFDFRLHQSAPGFELIVDHGDCHDRRSGHSLALYHTIAARYRDGRARWLADEVERRWYWREAYASGVKPGLLAEAYAELLAYDPTVAPEPPTGTAAYFPDLGLVAARTGWDDDATAVSIKAAPGGGHTAWDTSHSLPGETLSAGHHHPDAGSFVYLSHGAHLVVEDGYSNRKRAGHHNTVLVDGQGWADEDRYHVYQGIPYERQPRMRDAYTGGGWAFGTASSAAMYDPALGVRRLDRTFVFTPRGRLVLLDELSADSDREWTFLLHTDWGAEEISVGTYRIRSGSGQAWVRQYPPDGSRAEHVTTRVEANPTSSTPSLAITHTLRTLRVTTTRQADAAFLTALEPTDALRPAPQVARRLDCAAGYGIDFGDETVLLGGAARRIAYDTTDADAAALLYDADGACTAVAARTVHDGGPVTGPHGGGGPR
ncbi:MAG TPA: heparinase II/III family protein [Actinocatenispora sp.]